MTAVVTAAPAAAGTEQPAPPPTAGPRAGWRRHRREALPAVFVLANAIAFVVLRPGVNDLWAARARAGAVDHGVGLTYWFGWFGGGSTPGNYSIITPYLCAWIGTEFVGALAAVAVAVLATLAVRGTRAPQLAAALAALAAAANLWSGRVPFLLGCAFALGALLAVRARRRAPAVLLGVLAILGSPVAGAFLLLGLAGTFLLGRGGHRPVIAALALAVVGALGLDALVFGAGGPEPLSWARFTILLLGLGLLLLADLPSDLRLTVALSIGVLLMIMAVPNAMGSNYARFAWFCLPVAVLALGRAPVLRRLVLVTPLVVAGVAATIGDLAAAGGPTSSVAYYEPLVHRLAGVPDLADHRVEVVDHGSHAGYDALLGHAALARGWETQADRSLNAVLETAPLGPRAYRRWLDANAVGWVALPRSVQPATPDVASRFPEYALVARHRPAYLQLAWHDPRWLLYRVSDARPIVAGPAVLTGHTQSSMTIEVPCACTVGVRVRWSKFLSAVRVHRVTLPPGAATRTALVPVEPTADAIVSSDRFGWTRLSTAEAGSYQLRGSLGGLLH